MLNYEELDIDEVQYEDTHGSDLKLVKSIEGNTAHYLETVARAIDKAMPAETVDTSYVCPWRERTKHTLT